MVRRAGLDDRSVRVARHRRSDALVDRILDGLGFSSVRRGVNLNAWLLAHGFLTLTPGADASTQWLGDVDWSRPDELAMSAGHDTSRTE